jgi:FkbM family methyltransferase
MEKFTHIAGFESLEEEQNYTKYYNIRPGDVVVDAGAHVGIFTQRYAEKVGKDGLVLAFEPDFCCLGMLLHNTEHLANVQVFPYGLWDKNDIIPLYFTPRYLGSSSFTHYKKENAWSLMKVYSLDSMLESLGIKKVNFLKADIEGSEIRMLHGMSKTLKTIDALAIGAYHIVENSETEKTYPVVKNILDDCGFQTKVETIFDEEMVYANRKR